MGWKDSAEGGQSESIPFGKHDNLRVTRVLRETKKKGRLQSESGDPQLLCIVSDDQARERMLTLTLSEKAQWKLAQLLDAMGADLDSMDAENIGIDAFSDELFATRQLVDRPFSAEIRPQKDNPAYADIVPLRRIPTETKAPVPTDEIPF